MPKDLFTYIARVIHTVTSSGKFLFAFVLIIILPLLVGYYLQTLVNINEEQIEVVAKNSISQTHQIVSTSANSLQAVEELQILVSNLVTEELPYIHIAKEDVEGVVIVASSNESVVGSVSSDYTWHKTANAHTDTSVIYPLLQANRIIWRGYYAFDFQGETWYVRSDHDLTTLYSRSENALLGGYASLFVVLLVLLAIAWWIWRLEDYRKLYLYAEKQKSEQFNFMSSAVHELRAPLTAIKGYTSVLLESSHEDKGSNQPLERISLSTDKLLLLVNDFLEVARLQSGKVSLAIAPVNIKTVIERVANEARVLAEDKNLDFKMTIPAELGVAVDEKKFEQVVTNLLSNAIKYTDTGSVTISVKDDYKHIEIRIQDTGQGISAEDQSRLFSPFTRVGKAESSGVTGTGLGMWITKRLVELMKGTITIESIAGVGTHVVVRFPKTK